MQIKPMSFVPVLLILALAFSSCGVTSRQAVSNKIEDTGKIAVICPEARLYLPDFPSFNDRQAFFNDSLQYRRGMALRRSERGESRIITGFHYASDVEYGRIAASVAFAKLVSDPEYARLMALARRELESLRKSCGPNDSTF